MMNSPQQKPIAFDVHPPFHPKTSHSSNPLLTQLLNDDGSTIPKCVSMKDYLNMIAYMIDRHDRHLRHMHRHGHQALMKSLLPRLCLPIMIYRKFELAKYLLLRDLYDSFDALSIQQRLLQQKISLLYSRMVPSAPYLKHPKYAPYFWILYDNPDVLAVLSPQMSLGLRRMLSLRIESEFAMADYNGAYYGLQTARESFPVSYIYATRLPTDASTPPLQYEYYPELDQLLQHPLLRKKYMTLFCAWQSSSTTESVAIQRRTFDWFCFQRLQKRVATIQRSIHHLRSKVFPQIRRQRSTLTQSYRQLSVNHLSTNLPSSSTFVRRRRRRRS